MDSVNRLKQYFNEQNYEDLEKIGQGSSVTVYMLKDDLDSQPKVCLKVGVNLHKEVFVLSKFEGVQSLPKLYHGSKDHSIVEYCKLIIPYSRPEGLTHTHILQLLDDLAYMAVKGLVITDLSAANISFSVDKGFKIIDADNYKHLDSITVDSVIKETCGRLWHTLGYYAGQENIDRFKKYYLQTINDILARQYS
ncbi:protein kinase family protein [Lysinibacillus xylanilyticus]|uniref:hypothetical protein n=1 Tax=Lysinibacillus xylanilyticus TaxID=582475 RepID=UPI0036DE5E42